jgi:hypothetical protein
MMTMTRMTSSSGNPRRPIAILLQVPIVQKRRHL